MLQNFCSLSKGAPFYAVVSSVTSSYRWQTCIDSRHRCIEISLFYRLFVELLRPLSVHVSPVSGMYLYP